MRIPTPTHLDPTPCDGSTLECLACGMAVVAVFPLALWAVANPIVAAVVTATAVVALVTLSGLARTGALWFDGEKM
ncbi:hypothetical protein SAMN05216559_2115 [Halomicrobium zhouii]|uniref:Uncharacterized protein n=2 Tax=Halomicrobium zhouii TaxID=767519 RepID=A0A1I6L5Z4_9EURY|nr:hypothetical protein SAMN05216559_2115 [Halomicrobium zhouii]